jgi:hypothetical protein
MAEIPSPGSRSSAAGSLRCGVCGTESRHPPFRPSPPEQPPDLDLRPGEPVRSTMARWLQQCPGCGYCAPDITRAHPAAAEAVRAAPFRALLADSSIPPLGRRFLAWALVLEETGALHASAEATLHAAWVADDLGRPDLARAWRLDSVALWRGGPPLDPEQTVRVVDALRRAEAWDDAANTGRDPGPARTAGGGGAGGLAGATADRRAGCRAPHRGQRHAAAIPPPACQPPPHRRARRGVVGEAAPAVREVGPPPGLSRRRARAPARGP